MMPKRLLLLYTGGTIGMAASPQGLVPSPGLLPQLLQRFAQPGRTLDVHEYPDLIDSSAVTPAHWNRMINDIAGGYAKYDGFVLVHGTDTMAYTASALAFALQGLGKPVVLTGAQLPLEAAGSDGWNNLADALEAACQADLHEVVIAFDRVLLRGCRARKVDAARFHGFDSPNEAPLAEFGIVPSWHRARWRRTERVFQAGSLSESARIAALFLTPGAGAALIGETLANGQLDAALLMSYGNGNTPADPVLLAGVRQATAAGTLVLNITQAVHGAVEPGAYAASQPLIQAGALPGADLTPEAALAKLTWICTQPLGPAERLKLLSCSLVGEMRPL
jgi:L-asparaginase